MCGVRLAQARPSRSPVYEEWTKTELSARAQDLRIKHRSTMTKMELIAAVRRATDDLIGRSRTSQKKETSMKYELPPLPYAYDALEPHMSEETLKYHYDKHHKGYVDKLNAALDKAGIDLPEGHDQEAALESIIRDSAGNAVQKKLFNNAAQVWNHSFFWRCMEPGGGGEPGGELGEAVGGVFGGFDKFREQFVAAGTGHFGSGYVWLIATGTKLEVMCTANAVPPLALGAEAVLGCDLWEHAYYLDHRNDRGAFLGTFLDHLVNWEFAEDQLLGSRWSPR